MNNELDDLQLANYLSPRVLRNIMGSQASSKVKSERWQIEGHRAIGGVMQCTRTYKYHARYTAST